MDLDSIIHNSKILIIDDDVAVGMTLEEILKDNNFSMVRYIADSREAKNVYTDFRPDLVLLDIKMPRMDGLEVLKHLRQQARFSTLRIVMLTGSNHESDVRQCHDHGASDYVVKPTSLTDLAKELRRVTSCLGGATAR